VVWEGRSREAPPYPDLWILTDIAPIGADEEVVRVLGNYLECSEIIERRLVADLADKAKFSLTVTQAFSVLRKFCRTRTGICGREETSTNIRISRQN
jgi:hypothetical protein